MATLQARLEALTAAVRDKFNLITPRLPVVIRLNTACSSTATALATVTDGTTPWTFALVAGKTYRLSVVGTYQSVALTTGGKLGIGSGGGFVGTVQGKGFGAIVQAAAASALEAPIYAHTSNAAGSFILTSAVAPINAPHIIGMDIIIHCTTSGTITVQWATEVSTSASQLNAGSGAILQRLN